ncbi:MAG: FAD-binding oxidoreductase [Pseudodonghicola sp.]
MTLDALLSALGPQVVQPGDAANRAYLTDWTTREPVVPLAVLRPGSVQEVALALEICSAWGVPVVTQGGRTGLVGGAAPLAEGVVISLDRMAAEPEIDAAARTARVEAGVTLAQLQEAAAAKGMMFPVDIGSRGSCQIGGMISTNAGGMRAFREGVMRHNVLGLEAVLPDGRVMSAMNGFLKNNTGYDLKQLFIGAEGTLGVVTGAVLRLRPAPSARVTALLRTPDLKHALAVLEALETHLAGLSICEVMWPDYYSFASGFRGFDPLPCNSRDDGLTLLIEIEGAEEAPLRKGLQEVLEQLFEKELITDGAIAQSLRQIEEFWALREANEGLPQAFASMASFDVSLLAEGSDDLIMRLTATLRQVFPRLHCLWFGHLGDMNLHLGVVDAGGGRIAPEDVARIKEIVLSGVLEAGGSIAAEHGIGMAKASYMPQILSAEEIALSQTLRAVLDPKGIMNPGRLF